MTAGGGDPQGHAVARRGLMLVLSSPSGAGKTTLSRRLLEADPCVELSVSVTTRKRRANEQDGRDYHFINEPRFNAMVKNNEQNFFALKDGNAASGDPPVSQRIMSRVVSDPCSRTPGSSGQRTRVELAR